MPLLDTVTICDCVTPLLARTRSVKRPGRADLTFQVTGLLRLAAPSGSGGTLCVA